MDRLRILITGKNVNKLIEKSRGKINYKGDIIPEQVQQVFSDYDAFIFLTKGENFGHAIYESLSAGRPVITSYFTPWNELEEKKAGWNVDISDSRAIDKTLQKIQDMSKVDHQLFCEGAYKLAKGYYETNDFKKEYTELFKVS